MAVGPEPNSPNGPNIFKVPSVGHDRGTRWAQIGHKTKKAHRSEPLLSWNSTCLLVAEARFELWVMSLQTKRVARLVLNGISHLKT